MNTLLATRRGVLGAAWTAAALSASPSRAGTAVPEAASVVVPGPEDGLAGRFALRAVRGLSRGLVQAAALRVTWVGGPDGVTAANRFATSNAPDGRLLLLLPGQAAQLLLVGDTRARFEPRHWPAIAGSLLPAVVAGRAGLAPGAPLRLALPGPGAPEAAALLALDMMGRRASAVFLPAGMPPEAAVAAGVADVAVVTGPLVAQRCAAQGMVPWFSFDGGAQAREPGLADIPAFGEILSDPARVDLVQAVRAAGAALRVRGVLVLPALTSSDAVALWRGAARRWTEEEPDAIEPGTRRVGPEEASDAMATLCPPPEAALAYREWLLRRLGWQSS